MTFLDRYGPWAVVLGASEGLGEAYARGIAERGLNVVVAARRAELCQKVARDVRSRRGGAQHADHARRAAPQATGRGDVRRARGNRHPLARDPIEQSGSMIAADLVGRQGLEPGTGYEASSRTTLSGAALSRPTGELPQRGEQCDAARERERDARLGQRPNVVRDLH